jgi:hypothetical protein
VRAPLARWWRSSRSIFGGFGGFGAPSLASTPGVCAITNVAIADQNRVVRRRLITAAE